MSKKRSKWAKKAEAYFNHRIYSALTWVAATTAQKNKVFFSYTMLCGHVKFSEFQCKLDIKVTIKCNFCWEIL